MHQPDWIAMCNFNARHARVVLSIVNDRHALGLIDTNSDGREVCFETALAENGTWTRDVSVDDISLDYNSANGDYAWACGRATPGSSVTIEFRDSTTDIPVNEWGWWAYLTTDPEPDDEDAERPIPQRVK